MITSVFPKRLSHTNHSIYRELTAFSRGDPSDPLASARPRTTLPITQEITTIKTQEKGFSLRFPKGEPLKEDVSETIFNLEKPTKTQKYSLIRKGLGFIIKSPLYPEKLSWQMSGQNFLKCLIRTTMVLYP
jgi:hypothetical protein